MATLLGAVTVHTAALLLVAGVVRRAWINLDYIWADALAITGGITFAV